jgi:hypothetical protein
MDEERLFAAEEDVDRESKKETWKLDFQAHSLH